MLKKEEKEGERGGELFFFSFSSVFFSLLIVVFVLECSLMTRRMSLREKGLVVRRRVILQLFSHVEVGFRKNERDVGVSWGGETSFAPL